MNSWKTTLGGILSGGGLLFAQFFPEYGKAGNFVAALGSLLLGLAARDNDVTSEQARAGKTNPAPDTCCHRDKPPRAPLVLFLGLAIGAQLFTGCGTTTYKTAGTIVITADHATDAWLDYWATARALPGANVAELDRQDAQVKRVYQGYQAAMETVYWSRKTGTAADTEAATLAAGRAAQAVVQIVFTFLPPEAAAKVKAP